MSSPTVRQALTKLLTTQYRSLPMYLTYTSPWTNGRDDKALDALRHIVADQTEMSKRIAQYIIDTFGALDTGEYPVEYYDTHDLSLEYLLQKLLPEQKRSIAVLERCVEELKSDPAGKALAEEALGAARGHLELLEELAPQTSNSSA